MNGNNTELSPRPSSGWQFGAGTPPPGDWRDIFREMYWAGYLFLRFLFSSAADMEHWLRPMAEREARRVWLASLFAMAVPLVFIVVGSELFGPFSWAWKVRTIAVGAVIAAVVFIKTAACFPVLGTIAGIVASRNGARGLASAVGGGIHWYVRLIAAVISSELAISLIAIFLPLHENQTAATILVTAVLAWVSYAVWWTDKFVWPRYVSWISKISIIVAILLIMFPPLAGVVGAARDNINAQLTDTGKSIQEEVARSTTFVQRALPSGAQVGPFSEPRRFPVGPKGITIRWGAGKFSTGAVTTDGVTGKQYTIAPYDTEQYLAKYRRPMEVVSEGRNGFSIQFFPKKPTVFTVN